MTAKRGRFHRVQAGDRVRCDLPGVVRRCAAEHVRPGDVFRVPEVDAGWRVAAAVTVSTSDRPLAVLIVGRRGDRFCLTRSTRVEVLPQP